MFIEPIKFEVCSACQNRRQLIKEYNNFQFCCEVFEQAYTVRCARCGTSHIFHTDVSPELYFSVLACHNVCF